MTPIEDLLDGLSGRKKRYGILIRPATLNQVLKKPYIRTKRSVFKTELMKGEAAVKCKKEYNQKNLENFIRKDEKS